MRKYELTLMLRSEIDPKDEKKIAEIVSKLLSGVSATIEETTVNGKKMFAYPIKKQMEGVYVFLKLSGEAVTSAVLEKQAKLMPDVLRLMLVVV